jgi:hypothetical protein
MYDYRLYCLNHADSIIGVQTANCPDDAAALAYAQSELPKTPKCSGIEVWRRDRLVGRVEPQVTHQACS